MEALRVLNSRYQLLAVIKRGGFGTIYKGYDSVLGKEIAVKEINPDLLDEAWYIDQFQNEARHVAKMNHQNIVHIFDLVKTEDRRFYIVMEYIDGLDLNRLLQACAASGRRLPQHLAIHIVAEICKALDYAHNLSNPETHEPLNLVHQDISPSNIMISKHGVVKLIDFGIAGAQRKPGTGDGELALQGKLPYMSPEHVAPEYSLDNRSDIFSLGLVLYEVLEGKRFFHEEQGTEIIEALRNGKLKLKDLHHTPKPLQPILERALEKSPENRYQNANQFYIDLVTYFVLNADTTNIDEELGQFVARCAEVAGSPRNGSFDIRDDWPHYEPFPAAEERHDPPDKPDLLSWDGEKQNGSRDHETPSLVPTPVSAPTEQESLKVEGLEANVEPRDEVKTVIDAVRLATRGHGKLVARIGIGVLAAGLLFLLLDVAFRWTALGVGVYDWLFPPAIKIASVPAGAKVYLDNKPLDRVTPLSIDEIEPGVHELKLSKAQYAPVIKSIYVPGNGDVQIKGAQGSSGGRLYTFHFKTTLYLTSTPPGAAVLINGLKFGKRTPCSLTWEVGEPCRIEMNLAGFKPLSGFTLDAASMQAEIDDNRLWHFEVTENPTIQYKIAGRFGKFLTVNSNPSSAAIYVDNARSPVGLTGAGTTFFLSAGRHKITLRKKGYNSRTLSLKVTEATPLTLFASLSRPVKFVAYDAQSGRQRDIGATIARVVRNGRTVSRGKRTPSVINLLPQNYYAVFSKSGYKTVQVEISPTDRLVAAKLEPLRGEVSIAIVDEQTGGPISDVEIKYRSLDNPNMPERLFQRTDQQGTSSGTLRPGLYVFSVNKTGYAYQEKSVMVQASELNLIEFTLTKL